MSFHTNTKQQQNYILLIISKPGKVFKTGMKPDAKRQFLINCLESNGYIEKDFKQPKTLEQIAMEEYEQNSSSDTDTDNDSLNFNQELNQDFNQEFLQSLIEKEQSTVDPYGFNRTFIQKSDNSKRLEKIQQRGGTQEEMDFLKVKEQINEALNKLSIDNKDIEKTALNMYLNITNFYKNQENIPKDERIIKGENKGSVKKGYIPLILYYSLIDNYIYISENTLINLFPDSNLSDLPKAQKNIKIILGDKYNINKNDIHERTLCNLRNFINDNYGISYIDEIKKIILDLQNAGKFNKPALISQVAPTIKFVLKNKMKESEIASHCNITEDTIRKNEKIIKLFYKT